MLSVSDDLYFFQGKLKKMKLDKGRGKTEALDTTTTSTKKQTMEEKKEDKERMNHISTCYGGTSLSGHV